MRWWPICSWNRELRGQTKFSRVWAYTPVLKIYKKTGNISETAKVSGAGYYIANEIIQKEGSRQRKAALTKAKEIARQHAAAKVPIKEIARIMDRSPETIRLWLKS